jgi:RNA polymerase sigma factor (sigma-70 family)
VSLLERPGAWCHRVLTNDCYSRWRRRRTEQRWLSRQRRTESYHEPFDLDVIAFWAFVRTMPERPRTVVALFYGAGLTSLEISEIINVPHGTVRSDLSRARTLLARELGEV